MDIEIKQKKYWVRRRYWPWIGGGLMIAALLVWLAIGNFTSTLQVDTRGLSIATVADAQFDDYVSRPKKVAWLWGRSSMKAQEFTRATSSSG